MIFICRNNDTKLNLKKERKKIRSTQYEFVINVEKKTHNKTLKFKEKIAIMESIIFVTF